ncbi:hypothetical protein J2795_003967 [Chryseobacterium bernardetii]|uniref:Uncharacterized protein n=3 Tax=Chryseobacterium TaxID=59732 RepID=A0ACC6IZM4_9FLAO|nr:MULTISPECIES: hypothetical protein [Chryseobacterium]MDR6371745.1 hypothetical protein [Chryseobacterium vietnamense]MDR6443233.1 hypothetical protein [Chryseobacterium bernardetii]MDR6460711.1 hypothetical protein [Chryseobacterium vietnamense]
MQENVRKDFSPLVSKTWWFMTWLTRTFGILLLLAAFLIIAGLPVVISDKLVIFVIVAILYYPALAFGLYRFFHYQKRIRKRVVRKIEVDEKGIHYERADGTIDEIFYSNLKKYSFSDEYDVSISPRNKTYILKVNDNGSVAEVDFNGMDAGHSTYIGNLKALRRRYIQGIVYFRPDLRINPLVYDVFYINPVDFTFDHKKFWISLAQTFTIMILFCLVLGSILFGLVKWLF